MNRSIKRPVKKGVAKVPIVMQLEALECGAAALAMILAYYEKWVPLEQVRSDCGVSRDGSNAKNILKAARSYGLVAKGYRYDTESLRKNGKFPCIIHWNFNHFLVYKGKKGKYHYLNDPGKGDVRVTQEEFDKAIGPRLEREREKVAKEYKEKLAANDKKIKEQDLDYEGWRKYIEQLYAFYRQIDEDSEKEKNKLDN